MNQTDSKVEAQMIEWRHEFHRHPEFGFDVKQTSNFIAAKLNDFGIKVIRPIGETGLVGILTKGQGSKSIGLRADMDALKIQEKNTFSHKSESDGLMHACGHDGHSSMLLGAARHLAEKGQFDGTVYFIFQPAEEHGLGAKAMIDDGLFERFQIDAVYGLHNMPGLAEGCFAVRQGPIMASESNFEINLMGAGGHAALPHMGTDTMLLGAQIVVALQSIVSRNLDTLKEPAVVSVTEFITDGTVNVIPSNITIKGDCRCFTDEVLEKVKTTMEQIVSGLCRSFGVDYNFIFINSFFPTINTPAETEIAVKTANEVLGVDNVNPDCAPYMTSEDFSSMLRVRPGCYALLGNGIESKGGCALHNPHYDFNDRILMKGLSYWVQLVENQLTE